MKLRIAFATAAAAIAAASGAHAATANATATASIVAPGTLASTRDLDFGTIAKPTTGTTTVTVASAATGTATPSVSGGNGFVPTAGLARAATFRLTGPASTGYTITTNTLSFPTAGTNLTAIGSETPVAASGTLLTLPAAGFDDIYVGGHFDITSSTTPATYTGALTLTINFP